MFDLVDNAQNAPHIEVTLCDMKRRTAYGIQRPGMQDCFYHLHSRYDHSVISKYRKFRLGMFSKPDPHVQALYQTTMIALAEHRIRLLLYHLFDATLEEAQCKRELRVELEDAVTHRKGAGDVLLLRGEGEVQDVPLPLLFDIAYMSGELRARIVQDFLDLRDCRYFGVFVWD